MSPPRLGVGTPGARHVARSVDRDARLSRAPRRVLESVSPEEAVRLQERLRARVIRRRTFTRIETIGAVDCSHAPARLTGWAGIVVYRYPDLVELSQVVIEQPVRFPYVPGLLAVRELPLMLAAVEALSQMPELFLVDGQGLAHPRRFGIASHLGVVLDVPTIGCAKRVLIGGADPPGGARGSVSELKDGSETIGALVRTRSGIKPMVVSIGHRVDLASAIEITLSCCDSTRLPKPLREADRLVGQHARRACWRGTCQVQPVRHGGQAP